MPTVSIIVPCYNQAQYLTEAIESVFSQTFADWECIIINDGSPDNTEQVAKELCGKDNRIKYLFQPNAGVSAARNTAIKAATGEFILPLDADDKLHKEYLRLAMEVFKEKPDVSLVYSEAEYFGTRTGRWKLPEYNYKSLLTRNLIYCSALYRKTEWQAAGGYDEKAKEIEDWEFWIQLLYGEKKVHRLPEVGFYYRHHETSRNLALVQDDAKRTAIEGYIYLKHKKIYDEYLGSAISYLRTILKLNNEISNIKKSKGYKFSTRIVTLIDPIRNLIKPSNRERANAHY